MSAVTYPINREIRDKEVRVITESGEQLGVMPLRAALEIAANRELDLVKVQSNATPPVCKLMDYGKFRFEQAKRDKEVKKNQKITETKEIRLSPGIGQHDFDTKLKSARNFISEGDRVKVGVRFRGREMAHTDLGSDLLKRFAASCEDVSVVSAAAKLDGRQMSMVLAPKSNQSKQTQEGSPQNAKNKD